MTLRGVILADWSDESVAAFMGEPPPTNYKMRMAYFQVLASRIEPERAKVWWLLAGFAPPCFKWYMDECQRRNNAKRLRRSHRQ